MSKRLSVKDRKTILDAWKDGKESDIREKGFYVIKNKAGKLNVRKYKSEKPEEPPQEVIPQKIKKEDKENIL